MSIAYTVDTGITETDLVYIAGNRNIDRKNNFKNNLASQRFKAGNVFISDFVILGR